MCAAPRQPLINITIKKRGVYVYVCVWSAKRPASRVDTRGRPYAGRKTEGRSPLAAAGFFSSGQGGQKNNGIIMNRIFDRLQNFAAFYHRRTRKQESIREMREIAVLIYLLLNV